MGDRTRGLYGKFDVKRTDGKSEPGQKHEGCEYFVLDLTHDPHAFPALAAYAASCEGEYPLLAEDLRRRHVMAHAAAEPLGQPRRADTPARLHEQAEKRLRTLARSSVVGFDIRAALAEIDDLRSRLASLDATGAASHGDA